MKPKEWLATIVENRSPGGGYHVLRLRLPKTFPQPVAGSFAMISVGESPSLVLRRPMAFYDFEKGNGHCDIEILFSVVGSGTSRMRDLQKGEIISLLGPLGNSFSKLAEKESVWVVAGGIGIAPFLLYGRQLQDRQKKNLKVLFGFRNLDQLSILKDFKKVGLRPLSALQQRGGPFTGTVLELLLRELKSERPDRILTCGPEKMMERVCDVARDHQIKVEASLEAKMACGLGVCLSCVTRFPGIEFSDGKSYALLCQDGPIFTLESKNDAVS